MNFGAGAIVEAEPSTELEYFIQQKDSGLGKIELSNSGTPTRANFKIMSGLGFTLGPVIIDIPITYYPASNGFNLGITIGAVW
jgi:hypothetical protein